MKTLFERSLLFFLVFSLLFSFTFLAACNNQAKTKNTADREDYDLDDEDEDDPDLEDANDGEDDLDAYKGQDFKPDALSQGAGVTPDAPKEKTPLKENEKAPKKEVTGVAVSTSHPLATQAAMEVLNAGGNAVDAAVTASLVLAVVEPFASGLGGSGVMLLYDAQNETYHSLDYRAAAGLNPKPEGLLSIIGIPGLVHGLHSAHNNFGSLPWKDLVKPAYDLAKEGFVMNLDLERAMIRADRFLYENEAFVKEDGSLKKSGDLVIQEELAETLYSLMTEGYQSFYTGTIAQKIAEATPLTLYDLESYQSYYGEPIQAEFQGSRFISVPPPYSGITVLQMLRMAEILGTGSDGLDPEGFLEDLERITLVAYDRHRLIVGDPSAIKFNPKRLLSDKYLKKHLARDLSDLKKNPSNEQCTTHFSILDKAGNLVSVTNTLTSFWGSSLKVGGFYLNDTMSNFSNNKRNHYRPNGRPRSFIAPVIVEGGDGSRYAIGTPGGKLIPKLLFPIFCDHYLFDHSLEEAVNRQRFFFKGRSAITIEQDKELLPTWDLNFEPYFLTRYGFHGYFGAVEIAGHHGDGTPFAISDFRRQGLAQIGD